jgi:hypothetical protein
VANAVAATARSGIRQNLACMVSSLLLKNAA